MGELIISNVDERTLRALEKGAKAEGKPLQDWLRRKLELEAARVDASLDSRPTPEEVRRRVETADRIRAMTPRPLDIDSTDLIRADRDGR